MTRLVILLSLGLSVAAQEWPDLHLSRVASGLGSVTDVASVPDGSGRMVVLEQSGRIRLIANGDLVEAPFLDWISHVTSGGERGLLGIAFPPGFPAKRYFYINYTDRDGNTVISRLHVSDDGQRANTGSEEIILSIVQPYANHNGGQLQFGPDGYLYLGMGDGGSGGDPQNNAQRGNALLGKMLRIDTESGRSPYGVPATNPFVNRPDYRPEIWATGLRNPWRFSFDRETGDLWIADVGQNRAEEVNFQPASSSGGENYGWNRMEGLGCYPASQTCNRDGLTLPVIEYTRDLGTSLTGGYVYRGRRFPALQGIYFYADWGSGRLWGIRRAGDSWQNHEFLDTDQNFTTFGQDQAGEVYIASQAGNVYLLASGTPEVAANGVVNAASFGPGLVPGSLATIFGNGLTSFNGIVKATEFPLPATLSGTSVTVNDTEVPILAVAQLDGQEQINFQVPLELVGASQASLTVTANGQKSAPVDITLSSAQPEIFAVTRSADAITIWATGLGAVSDAPGTGQSAPSEPLSKTIAETQVSVGGTDVRVLYSGLAPGFAGLYQVNAATTATGEIVLRVGSAVSRPWREPAASD
jgi:uncharacterized protein (TIGR03437 family)